MVMQADPTSSGSLTRALEAQLTRRSMVLDSAQAAALGDGNDIS